jgi:hypothetical protein
MVDSVPPTSPYWKYPLPSPTVGQLESFARSALDSAGIRGAYAKKLALALANTTAQALAIFLNKAQVRPNIPASAPPPGNSGSTMGPGPLVSPPAGPTALQVEALAQANLDAGGIAGENAPNLAKTIAASLEQAVALFTAQVLVDTGIAIVGLLTSSPGPLIWIRKVDQDQLQPLVDALRVENGLLGADAPALAGAIAKIIAEALALLLTQAKVAPGIPCSPGATTGPGKLM